jgi:hypothetical protein
MTAAALLGLAMLSFWSWSYQQYRDTMRDALSAQAAGDPQAFTKALNDLEERSRSAWLIHQVDILSRRLTYASAVEFLTEGNLLEASAILSRVSTNQSDELASVALYNQANLTVANGQLETARGQYIESLILNPIDLQGKINLELLLVRIKQQQQGRDKLEARLRDLGALTDIWLREDPKKENEPGSSRHVWR